MNTTWPGVCPWTVDDLQFLLTNRYRIALLQPTIRDKYLGWRKTRHLAGLRQFLQPEIIFTVRPLNRYAQLLAQHIGGGAVVHVGVCEDNFFHSGLHLFNCRQNALDIAAGINDGRTAGVLTFDDRAVLLVGRDGDDGALDGHRQVSSSLSGCHRAAV
jgi:hypothetical protein